MGRRIYTLLVSLLLSSGLFSQAFTNVAEASGVQMLNNGISTLGLGLSAYDIDKDGWDDLTFSSAADSLIVYHNLGGTGFQRMALFPPSTDAKAPVWVDYDNDGDADILWTKRSNGTVFYRNDGNMVFTDVTANLNLPAVLGVHIYGQSWGDYDRDGFLDVYLCTYNTSGNIQNYLLHNNGNGTFTNLAAAANVNDGMRATFQGVWQDMNDDGWLDLYVINDLGMGNEMYMNDQDGTFTSVTIPAGLVGNNMQSMSNSICDFDNDGDWDIYVTNIAEGNAFFVNNGNGTYTEQAVAAGIVTNTWCWGAKWIDYDHNLLEDLHVTTATNFINQDFFYINNGDGTFANPLFPEFAEQFEYTYSSAKGDFNHDGYWDFAVTTMGESSYYQVWQNNGGTNNWVKLSLEGTVSNRDAVGTYIQYFIDGNRYLKYTHCGEDFLAQDSQHEILSLGSAESIDSLIITWPRGLVEKWYNIPASSWLDLLEGETVVVSIAAGNEGILCGDDVLVLDAGEYDTYLWSTMEETQTIGVTEAGIYSVVVRDENGYEFSAEIEVVQNDLPVYDLIINEMDCWYSTDASITVLHENEDDFIVWEDSSNEFERTGLTGGDYEFTLYNSSNCAVSGQVSITAPDAIVAIVSTTSVSCFGGDNGSVSLDISGGTGDLNIDWNDINPEQLGADIYTVVVSDSPGCELLIEFEITSPPAISSDLEIDNVSCFGLDDGAAILTISGGTGQLTIDWQGADPDSLAPGQYSVIITDENQCEMVMNYSIEEPPLLMMDITTTDVICPGDNTGTITVSISGGTGNSVIDWNGVDPEAANAGTYTIEAEDQNSCHVEEVITIGGPEAMNANLETEEASGMGNGWASVSPEGGTSPYSYLWSNNDMDSLAEDLTQGSYTCTITDAAGCEYVIEAEIGFNSVSELPVNAWTIYPNPADDIVFVRSGKPGLPKSIEVFDMGGRRIRSVSNQVTLDVSELAPGYYFLEINDGEARQRLPFVKR